MSVIDEPAAAAAAGRCQLARDLAKRLWAHVDRSGGPDACHPWTGSRTPAGYGRVTVGGRVRVAHRVALSLSLGRPLEPDEDALHACDNPPCCNPRHLRPGTQGENNQDRSSHGRTARQTGTTNGRAILDEVTVRRMRRTWQAGGWSYERLATAFGVSKRTARLAVTGQTWGHVK